MATLDFSASNASASSEWANFTYIGIISNPDADFTGRTATGFTASWNGLTFKVVGTGFSYNGSNEPKAGTVTGFELVQDGPNPIKLSGLSVKVPDIKAAFNGGDLDAYKGFFAAMLSKNDVMKGSSANDYLEGFAGHDKLIGNNGHDKLFGGKGDDTMNGGVGADTMDGGSSGADHFQFTTALGSGNVDYIINLSGADVIELSNTIFTGTGADGTVLAASKFKVYGQGDQLDANDRILYVKSAGDLYFDPDGSGVKGAFKFAHIEGAPALTNADFLII